MAREGSLLKLLEIRDGNRLYWAGQPVITEQHVTLTRWQRVGAFILAIGAFAGGIGGAVEGWASYNQWACDVKLEWAWCAPTIPMVVPAVAPVPAANPPPP